MQSSFLNRPTLFYLIERSIELKPNEGFSKYMNLGQILVGHDAVAAIRKGIELIRKELLSKAQRQVRHPSFRYFQYIRSTNSPPFSVFHLF